MASWSASPLAPVILWLFVGPDVAFLLSFLPEPRGCVCQSRLNPLCERALLVSIFLLSFQVLGGGHTDPASSSDPSAGGCVYQHRLPVPISLVVLPFFLSQNRAHPDTFFCSTSFPTCFQILHVFLACLSGLYCLSSEQTCRRPSLTALRSLCLADLVPVPACWSLWRSRAGWFSAYLLSAVCRAAVGTGAVTQATVLPPGAHLLERGAASGQRRREVGVCGCWRSEEGESGEGLG